MGGERKSLEEWTAEANKEALEWGFFDQDTINQPGWNSGWAYYFRAGMSPRKAVLERHYQ